MVTPHSSRLPLSRGAQPSRRLASALFLGVVFLAGCDTLGARFKAREGVELYRAGDMAGSAAKFEDAARLDPKMPTIQLDLGTANLAVFRNVGGKAAEGQAAAGRAIRAYERYLELKPKDERVKVALVQTFVDTNRYDDAVAFFQPAVDKKDPEALNTIAVIAAKCGKTEEAEAWHRRRIEAAPDKPEGYLSLGVLLWEQLHDHQEWPAEQRKPKVDAALEVLKKAIELQPNAPNAYTYTNLVYRELAASEKTDDEKRVALEQANRYYQMAVERQGKGH